MRRLPSILRALAWLGVYVAAVVWATWPLGAGMAVRMHGANVFELTDALYSLWVMDWLSHALVTSPATVADAPIYHPTPDALFYGPMALGGLPFFAPVSWATGNPVLATNVVFIAGIALTAWTTHLVARRWTGSDAAAMVAALTIVANGWLVHGFGARTPHAVMLPYLPLLAWAAATPAKRLADALWLVPLVVVQSLTELMYVAPAVFAVLGTLALLRLARSDTRAAGRRLLVALAASALLLAPLYAGYAMVRQANPDLGTVNATRAMFQPMPAQLLEPGRGPAVFLPATLVLLALGAIASIVRRPPPPARAGWRHGLLWLVVGVLISLSPEVYGPGGRWPVPQMLVEPVFQHLRAPARLGVVAMIGTAMLSGLAFAAVCAWTPRLGAIGGRVARVALAGVCASALLLGWGVASPTAFPVLPMDAPPTAVTDAVARTDGPVLELPVGFALWQSMAMYHATFHRRPLVNGYSSYFPAGFSERMALTDKLPDAAALATLREQTGVALLWVHLDRMRMFPSQRAAWLDPMVEVRPDLRRVLLHGDDLILRVVPPPAKNE